MVETDCRVFTPEQYDNLREDQKEAIHASAKYNSGFSDIDYSNIDEINKVFDLVGPVEGCVPDHYVAELMGEIMRKFDMIYGAATQIAEQKLHIRETRGSGFLSTDLTTVIEPSYESTTRVAVINYEHPYCYYFNWQKAWCVYFDNLEELADEILQVSNVIIDKYRKLHES